MATPQMRRPMQLLRFVWSTVCRSVVKQGADDATSLARNAAAQAAAISLNKTYLEEKTKRVDARMRTLRFSAKEWLRASSRTDLVPCEVSVRICDGERVMAELNRIGSWVHERHEQNSRKLIWVGIPYDDLILFEKWLSRTFHGDATSTLLPINGDP
jgi:hypothetical protein